MSEFRAAYRYALALLGVAEEVKKLDAVSADIASIESLVRDSREFLVFLRSPVVNSEKKKKLLKEIFQGKVSDVTLKFVALLAAKGRERLLPEIMKQFAKLRDARLGILNVKARTAVAFKPEQERELVARLEAATKKKVRLSFVIDPSLKGGFMVQHDDTVWDASVRRQLELLRERFTEGVT
ncbi:MAG TPA: ATP synthase F1 subunit delta [Bacteroidota bacterium]|jgi:F-type H+-transporting ATPase subunit delta|nr:ATP synthase F1 subunit delta [Bacteroidota bacterium]